jgi:ribonuclease J
MEGDSKKDYLPQPLFNDMMSGETKPEAVFLSHAHPDHYGLASFLPSNIPIYCGKTTQKLMELSSLLNPSKNPTLQITHFQSNEEFEIGPFRIKPYLMDHSAMDAYGFLVQAGGKTLFYTGDFRGHGRKKRLFEELIANPPAVDVLLMEGTMVGPRSDEAFSTEAKLEEEFIGVMKRCEGTVFVTASSQNVDRLVTIYKAARSSNRRLVIDLYTAEVLDSLTDYPRIPKASWPRIRVGYSGPIAKRLEEKKRQDILEKHRKNAIKWPRIHDNPSEYVVLCRPSVFGPIKRYLDFQRSAWIYSLWKGYLEFSEPLKRMKRHFDQAGTAFHYIHSGGHARLTDLKSLVEAINPGTVIPIHTFHPDLYQDYFQKVKLVEDGERIRI